MSESSAVVARFYVSGYEVQSYDIDAVRVKMQAVSRGEHNKNWAKYTPSGMIEMTIKNPGAADWFIERIGQEVEVRFTPAGDEHYRDQYGERSVEQAAADEAVAKSQV